MFRIRGLICSRNCGAIEARHARSHFRIIDLPHSATCPSPVIMAPVHESGTAVQLIRKNDNNILGIAAMQHSILDIMRTVRIEAK